MGQYFKLYLTLHQKLEQSGIKHTHTQKSWNIDKRLWYILCVGLSPVRVDINGCDVAPVRPDDVRMRQHRYTHTYTDARHFSHLLAKSNLLRPFYDSLTKLWSMEITFSWLDIPLSCLSRPTSGDKAEPRQMPNDRPELRLQRVRRLSKGKNLIY